MKITLILAAHEKDPLKMNDPFMPLSFPLLAASAPDHEYYFVDMLAGEIVDFARPADLVGISYRITAEKQAFRIAEEFRKRKIPVVLGGPQVSSNPLAAVEKADSIVIGEGETVWPLLLDDFQNNRMKKYYINTPRDFQLNSDSVYQNRFYQDLTTVPKADRRHFKKRYVFDTVFAARGCPIDCDFCSVTSIYGSKVRTRNIDDVIDEISRFKSYYYLLDDTVFGRPSLYDYYLELYQKIAALKKVRFWTGQANLDAASTEKGREVIRQAAKAGLLYAAIGMESINPVILKKSGVIHKLGVKSVQDIIKQMEANIEFIQDQGIIISGWFTIGYAEDTLESYYQTWEFCRRNHIIPVISPLEALPGTRLFKRLEKENKIDYHKKINIIHPRMDDKNIIDTLLKVNQNAYSLKEAIDRTIFYSRRFDKYQSKFSLKINNRIHKTIFAFILQRKLKKGVIGFANDDQKDKN